MWYMLFPFFAMCFFVGCMLSKVEHEQTNKKFDEVMEQELPPQEEIDFILSSNA